MLRWGLTIGMCVTLLVFAGCAAAPSRATTATAVTATTPTPATPCDLPRMSNVTIDGNDSDWAEGGFKIGLFHPDAGLPRPGNESNATARRPAQRSAWM